MLQIPFKDFPSFTEEITLDNVPYIFRFDWNSRGEYWSMDVYDREQNALLTGKRLVLYLEMFTQYANRGLPPGQLFIVDVTLDNKEIEQDDFTNDRLAIVYITEDEVAAFR